MKRTLKPADEKFTSADVRTMTPDEITDYWVRRQRWMRDNGREHYTTLVDPVTDEICATID